MNTNLKQHRPHVAAAIKTTLDCLAGLARPLHPRRARDPVAYAAALEILG